MPFHRNIFFFFLASSSACSCLQARKVGSQRGCSLHSSHPTLSYRPAAQGPGRTVCGRAGMGTGGNRLSRPDRSLVCAAQVQDGGGAHRLPSVRSPLRGQEGRLHTLLPGSRGGLCLIEQAGVGLLPDHNIGDAEVGEGLPGLDETQLGFRQRELGHVLVGFQDPWSELQDQAGEGLPRSLRPPACPHQGDRMWSLGWGQCPAWGHWSAPCLHSAA